jgi:deoxyribonuclease-4
MPKGQRRVTKRAQEFMPLVAPHEGNRGNMTRELLVGAHMSIAGGIHHALGHGLRAGCRTVQIFLKSSNQWKGKILTDEDRRLYLEARKESGIEPVVAHNSYLINLASPDPALNRKSLDAFVEEMRRASFLGIPCVILHPGSHMGAGPEAGIALVAAALNRALDRVPPPVRILLENTAGQGHSLGHRFDELAAILERVRQPARVDVCLDTCHAFAAGYDIRTPEGYRKTMREFDRLIGIERIAVFHVNDCKKGLGSRVDRHTHIGQGFIGLEAFRCLVNDRRFAKIPKILETPKGPDLKEDLMNLATLRSLVK